MKPTGDNSADQFRSGRDHSLLRNGIWFDTGDWLEVKSPWDGASLGRVPWAGADAVEAAIQDAHRTMVESPLRAFERSEVLFETARIIGERSEMLARTISAEAGKPITLARLEVSRATETVKESAVVARNITGTSIPIEGISAGAGHSATTIRVPVGVIGAITPFNFPLNLCCHKLAPAIAAGCAVVHKPADKTPLSAIALAECFEAAGLPAGWLNVVLADPIRTSEILLEAPEVGLVTFTGSAAVGWSLARAAERTKVSLELGNSTPVIVSASADLDRAAEKTVSSAYGFAGQACVSAQRVLAVGGIHDEFVDRLASEVDSIIAGDPADPETLVGPVINSESRDRILSWVRSAVQEGARLERGGETVSGNVVAPTLLSDVMADAPISCREVFGPVLVVTRVDSFAEAIDIANSTDYGLQAAVFTSNLAEVQNASRNLDFGGVIINDAPSWRADPMPYGGVKASGNTKEGPGWSVREMTEERLIVIADDQ